MRSKFLLIALGSALAGCQTPGTPDDPGKGLSSLNVPVVTSADYVFDAAAPGGTLAPGEGDRLNGWFQGLGLGYGDTVYVDGGYAPAARGQVAAVAGRYGMLLTPGAPVTAGMVQTMSNFGCGVNSNLAAMVANPEDLIHGRDSAPVTDAVTATRAIDMYRKKVPTGQGELKDSSAKGGK